MWWRSHRGPTEENDDAPPVREETFADRARRPGEPLDPLTRARMEQALGIGLDDVRVHHDSQAAGLARDARAAAFTNGREIYFGAGTYAPESPEGEALLAHELAHVAEQRSGDVPAGTIQRQPLPGAEDFKLQLSFETVRVDDFDSGQSAIKPAHKIKLDAAADSINSTLILRPDAFVFITGFTDAVDSEKNNLALGHKRAGAVLEYLASKGVPRASMNATSLGEAAPIVDTRAAEPRNRRVDVDIHRRGLFQRAKQEPSLSLQPQPPAVPQTPVISLTPKPPPFSPEPDLTRILSPDLDAMIRRAREMQPKGKSASDVAGGMMHDLAKNLGFGKRVQNLARSFGETLPAKGLNFVADQLMKDRSLTDNEKEALHKALEALSKTPIR